MAASGPGLPPSEAGLWRLCVVPRGDRADQPGNLCDLAESSRVHDPRNLRNLYFGPLTAQNMVKLPRVLVVGVYIYKT